MLNGVKRLKLRTDRSDLESAEGILADILTLRMYGEDERTSSWRELEIRIESFLRRNDPTEEFHHIQKEG